MKQFGILGGWEIEEKQKPVEKIPHRISSKVWGIAMWVATTSMLLLNTPNPSLAKWINENPRGLIDAFFEEYPYWEEFPLDDIYTERFQNILTKKEFAEIIIEKFKLNITIEEFLELYSINQVREYIAETK